MNRIAIFGSPGSGKSTLARRLSARLGLPVTHIDMLYFDPGWVIKPADDFRAALADVVATDQWITDGNYTTESVTVGRVARADVLIMLHAPRTRCLWRVVRRSALSYGRVRADQAVGCPERFDLDFFKFVWNYPAKAERVRRLLLTVADQKTVYFLNGPKDIERFMQLVVQQKTVQQPQQS
jgi:adenylate kinase family enzyme